MATPRLVAFLAIVVVMCVCGARGDLSATMEINLDSNWYTSNSNGTFFSVPASVPGEIHTDLFRAGKIGEPYYRFNDVELEWVALDNWTYTGLFTIEEGLMQQYPRRFLRFEGLDTVASIVINESPNMLTDNMYRTYLFDVSQWLTHRNGANTNTLVVSFTSALAAANHSAAMAAGQYPVGIPPQCPPAVQNGYCHVNYLRKSPCSFSWDWGPAFATQGIWRNVTLILAYDEPVYMESATALATLVSGGGAGGTVADDATDVWNVTAVLRLFSDVEPLGGRRNSAPVPPATVTAQVQLVGTAYNVTESITVDHNGFYSVTLPNVQGVNAWWPNGYGAQPLYQLNVTVFGVPVNGQTVVQYDVVSFGFRTVELMQDPIPGGTSFEFHVNHVPIFIKGANWVPADAFESRVNTSSLDRLLSSLVDANMNAVRNWGGGIYQRNEFYDLCDQKGLLVWEEFMFACSMYPVGKDFLANVAEEVVDNVFRLMNHPSIFVWSTNNENEVAIAQNWYGTSDYTQTYSKLYSELYFDTVLASVATMDMSRPTLSSSPSDGNETAAAPISYDPQDSFKGDVHFYSYNTDCWDVTTYPRPRFASEFGVQAWPSFITMSAVSNGTAGDWSSMNSPFMQHRQHHPDGNAQMMYQMELHFTAPNNTDSLQRFKDTLLMTQVVQAVCMKTEAEHYRRLRSQGSETEGGFTMGTLYWQANDIWQGASWASQDYTGRWKMLHYYAKHFYAPFAVSGYIEDGNATIYAVNDAQTSVLGSLVLEVVNWKTGPVATSTFSATAPSAGSAQIFTQDLTSLLNNTNCTVDADCVLTFAFMSIDGEVLAQNHVFLGDFVEMGVLADPSLMVESVDASTKAPGSFDVTVTAANVAPFVWLETSIPGVWSDNGFLLTASSTVVTFTPWNTGVTVDDLKGDLMLTSLYDMYSF